MQEIENKKEIILREYQIRKSQKQKSRFIEYVKEEANKSNWKMDIDASGTLIKNRNIIVGDIDAAEYIFTAHYDTCAWSPFANRIWFKNIGMYLLSQIYLIVFFLLFGFIAATVVMFVTGTVDYTATAIEGAMLLLCFQVMFGFRNSRTANDNTSGVLTLLAAMERINEKEKVAFVFFDNEEKGLIGSGAFKRKYEEAIKNKLLINFDCVGDGDVVFLAYNKGAQGEAQRLMDMFKAPPEKEIKAFRSNFFAFSSDQAHFKTGIGVATAHKSVLGGYTVGRLHTARDTVLDVTNIKCLVDWIEALSKEENSMFEQA